MSGLFEEDEYEVTGFRQVASNKRRNLSLFLEMSIHPEQEVLLNKLPDSVVTLLRCQYSNPFLSFDDLSRDYVMLQMDASTEERGKETWQFQDMNRICSALLTLCKPPGSSSIPPLSAQPENPLHFWLQDGQMIDNNAEFVRIQQLIQVSVSLETEFECGPISPRLAKTGRYFQIECDRKRFLEAISGFP